MKPTMRYRTAAPSNGRHTPHADNGHADSLTVWNDRRGPKGLRKPNGRLRKKRQVHESRQAHERNRRARERAIQQQEQPIDEVTQARGYDRTAGSPVTWQRAPQVDQLPTDRPVRGGVMDLSLEQVEQILELKSHEVAVILGLAAYHLDAPRFWPPHAHRRWKDLVGLALRLEDTFERDSVGVWLRTPNRDLHWQVPIDLLRAGQLDEIDAALEALDSGVFV